MPYCCSALNCKIGYGTSKIPSGVSIHRYPINNPSLLKLWLKNISRENFTPTKSSRICSLHFLPSDFISTSVDKNVTRQKKLKKNLVRKILKPCAIPTVFENLPKYIVSSPSTSRSGNATSTSRLKIKEQRYTQSIAEMFEKDRVYTLSEIEAGLNKEKTPKGFHVWLEDDILYVCYIQLNDVLMPSISASVMIEESMRLKVFVDGNPISSKDFKHLLSNGIIETLSQVINIMSLVKSWVQSPENISWFHICTDSLQKSIESTYDDNTIGRFKFILEQLHLSQKQPQGRRFSPSLMVSAYAIQSCGARAYQEMRNQNLLILPSQRRLRKITQSLESPQKNNDDYLHLRISSLPQYEKHVSLVIDEIYVAKRVELARSSGQVIGLTTDQEVASTVLCFMIASVAGKNRDVVAMYPIKRLTAARLESAAKEVLVRLEEIGYNVIAIVTDNLAVNRRFMVNLSGTKHLEPVIANPANPEKILHLLFDSTHNLKNVYNIWQRKKVVKFPCGDNLNDIEVADFRHLEELHAMEDKKTLKMAHKLNKKVIFPSSMEKMSVKLALSVFCESTRDALNFYINKHDKEWAGTAHFISLILQYWNVVNVKTTTAGIQKRDKTKEPLRSSDGEQLQFLEKFVHFLTAWKSMPQSDQFGLTSPTFAALTQTSKSLIKLSKYCLCDLGFHYVLLSKFLSDCLEGRFGRYRQMNGGNYFLSCRQLFENERKVRAISLLKFSKCSLSEISDMKTGCADIADVSEITSSVSQHIESSSTVSVADANVLYYVTGALIRFVLNRFMCEDCSVLLLEFGDEQEKLPLLVSDGNIPSDAQDFLNSINRGGLLKPNAVAFSIGLKCWHVYSTIFSTPYLKHCFLSYANHRTSFINVVVQLLAKDCEAGKISTDCLTCESGHCSVSDLIARFFNCMSKNLVSDMSAIDRKSSDTMKRMKLTGQFQK